MRYLPICGGSAAAPAEASARAGADSATDIFGGSGAGFLHRHPARNTRPRPRTPPYSRLRVTSRYPRGARRAPRRIRSMMSAREELLDALRAAMAEVSPGNTLAAAFETPKQADHGDLAVTAAMPLAKAQKRNPREVAVV